MERDLKIAAQELALDLQENYTSLFARMPVRPTSIAKWFHIGFEEDPGLKEVADFVYSHHDQHCLIRLRSRTAPELGRLAVAHELGHAMLMSRNVKLANALSNNEHEEFARVFAAEILVPHTWREEIASEFAECANVKDLVAVARRVGVSVGTLLWLARDYFGWFENVRTAWLKVREEANPQTGTDVRFRIGKAYYDRNQFFIPEHHASLNRVLHTEDWLREMKLGDCADLELTVSVKLKKATSVPRYPTHSFSSRASALCIRSSGSAHLSYYVGVWL